MAGFDPSKYGSKKSKIYGSSAADTRVDSGTETGFDPSRYGDSKSKLYSPGSMVITPEPVETQQKKRERQVVSPYGTFLGGFSFAGDRQKTAKELADEKAQQELPEQEYQRLLGLELDKYRTEVEKAGKKAQEEKAPYNIHAFGGYDANRTTEAERQYAAMKADLNKAESLQYDVKGREALDKLTEEQTAALEVLASTEGVPAAAAQADYDRKVAARETLLASGLSEDELSQLVNYQRNIPKREKNAERYAKVQEMARNEGEKSPIGGTLLSVPANLLSGIGTVYTAVEKLRNPDTPADYHSPAMLPYAYASGVRGEVTKNLQYDHGDAAAFAYGVGTSMLDSAATAALAALGVPPAAASATLGGAAATDAMVAAKDRGLDDSHAIVTGVAAGVMESFFEKVSLESLIHMKLPTGTSKQKLAGMLKNAAIQGGIEGSEEMFTDLANLWWDKVINGDMADVEQRINAYMAGGMSHQEAQQKVVGETIKDIALDFGAGALAGGIMGGGNMAVQTAVQHSNELTAERYRQFLQEAGVQLDDQQSAEDTALTEASDKYGAQAEVFRSTYAEGQDVALYDSAYRIAYEYGKAGAKEEAVMQQEDLSYLSETQRKIAYIAGREAAAWQNGLGENGGKAWAEVQNADVESKGKLQAGFTVLYQAGLRRESAANVKSEAASALPQSVQTAAYEAGLSDAAASLAREKAGLDFVSSAGSESGLVDNEHARKMAKDQAGTVALLNTLGKNLGVRIEMVDTISGGKANGVYIGGKNLIQIAADADNAFGFVAAHEVTHRMQELAPEEYRAYRDHAMSYRARESGEEGAAAYVERYRAMAEEAGVKLTQEEAMDEIAADFTRDMMENGNLFEDFAKENRSGAKKLLDALKAFIAKVKSLFRSKTAQDRAAQDAYGKSMAELEQCAALWQKAYDAAGKQAQKTKTAAREGDGEGRYQIKNIDGRLMTVIDTQNDTRDFKAAEAYLKTLVNTEHPFSTILMDAQPVFVGKDLPGEYKSSEYTKTMKPALRKIKMQAATNLDEMLLLAENGEWRENVKPKHAKDAQNGWYRYDTEFAVPVLDAKKTVDHYTVYGGTLLIRNDADGKSYLYDLLDVEKKKVISKTSFSAETHSEVTSPKPSTDSISTSGEKVNGKFSLKAYSDVEKKQHVKDAKAFFGRTYKWAETGYITTDGARLDFSGKHEGGPGGYRTVDHRDIRDALGDDYGGDDYSGAMVQFMGEGNIRISPESGGINLSVMPTKAQMDTLSDFISKERGEVVLDLDDTNGVTLSSTEYPRGTHSSKVLNDIKAFFETGAVPQVSELGRFRYQLKNFSEQAVSTALYDALSEKATRQNQLIPVSVMPRYISEKLGIGGDIYIQRDHAYENMVSKEQAIQDGRPTQRKGENVHFHDLGVEKMTRAIMSINEPTMTISTKTKDGNPAVIMMLPEYGNNNAPLYAVLSFYSRKTISPENRETRPHVVLTIAERNFFEEGGRYGWADVIKRAINEGTVIDFNKKERSSLSEVAQSVGLGDITDASLKKNLAQFQKEVKQFRESNNIRYQLKSATELEQEVRELTKYAAYRQRGTTDREILLSAAEGSAKTEWERKRLAEYRDAVGRLEGYEARLSANRAELTGLSLADGKKNAKRISYLKDDITKDTNRVAIVENKLKDLEGNRSLQELLGRERAMLQQQERTYLGKVEELLGGYRGLYGTMRKGEKAARDIQLPKKSSEDEKISQTVRTVLEAKATPEEMVPDIETLALEGKYSYEVYSDKAAIADASRTIKRVGWAQALTDWKSAMKAGNVSKKNTAMGWALYNNAANSGDTETALDVLSDMVQHQRSAAQALQATRILKQLSPETQLYQAQRTIANLQTQLNEEYGDDKAPKLKIDQTLAEQFMKAADQAERDAVLANIYRDIGKQMPSRFKDKWNAWRYLAMLGNVRTHVRNIFGNAFFMPVVAAKNAVATGIEKAVYRLSGGKMERSKEFVTGKGGKALLEAAAQDYAKVADVAMGGGKFSDFANANKYIDEGRVIFKTKPLEAARKANSKALDAEDAWFSKPHYAYAMAQYCKANGITAEMIAKGGDKVVKAREYAIREAQKATYRDTNAFSQAISELGRMGRNSKNGAKRTISTVMEGILPFRKTPANILARGVEYSPIGFLRGLWQATVGIKKGTTTAAEAIDAISAGLTGTGLLALGVFLAAQGLVRGHGDDDDKKNTFMELAGHQAYALELPNGTSVTLDWLAPECLPFFVGVNLWELTDGNPKLATMADLFTAVSQVSEPMLEMSCLQSLNDVFDSVGYASSNGLAALPTALANAATSYVAQGIPTILGQAERTGEGLRYTTFTSKNSKLTNNVQYALGRASAKIPIWDYSQIPYIDAWGRTESTGEVGTRAFNNFLNPAYTSTVDMSAMEEELLRLYEVTGESVLPRRASKYFNVDKKRVDLTGEQYVTYAQKKGSEAYKWLTELTQNATYRSMSDEEKADCIARIYSAANEVAKAEVVSSYEPTKWVKEAMSGAGVVNTAIAKTAMSGMTGEDYDGDGKNDAYSKIDKQLAYINSLAFSASQKRAMAIAFDINEKTIDKRAPW
jgi:hypothetical protein